MAFNGSGVYVLPAADTPAVANTLIESTKYNNVNTDLATALSTCITKDGQTTVTSNIPFNSNKLTGVAAGTARTDAATLANVQDGTGVYVATVGGTADVITLTPSPTITAYSAGQKFRFIASGANTTNVTVAVSGLAAKAITKEGTTALKAGDIPSGKIIEVTYDGTRFILTDVAALALSGGVLTGLLNLKKGADVASAASLPLINDGNYFDVTGTTTITSFASLGVGSWIGLHFDGALILTHHATDLILPSGGNITTAAGDEAIFVEYASGDWRCVSYTKASGLALIQSGSPQSFRNLIGAPASSITYRVRADHVVTVNPTSKVNRSLTSVDITSSDLSAAQGASAANGRDQSATFGAGLIYCYVISGSGQTNALLFSLSETAPTLPTNYTEWALVGPLRWGGTSFDTNYRYNGNLCTLDDGYNALVNGTATTETSVSLTGYVSTKSISYHLSCTGTATADGSANLDVSLTLRSITTVNRAVLRCPYKAASASSSGMPTWLGQNVELGNVVQDASFFYQHTVTVGSSPLTTITLRAFTYPNGAN